MSARPCADNRDGYDHRSKAHPQAGHPAARPHNLAHVFILISIIHRRASTDDRCVAVPFPICESVKETIPKAGSLASFHSLLGLTITIEFVAFISNRLVWRGPAAEYKLDIPYFGSLGKADYGAIWLGRKRCSVRNLILPGRIGPGSRFGPWLRNQAFDPDFRH